MAKNTQTIGGDKKRKDKTTILGPHAFRMSNYGQRDYALDMWLLHFERLGVPAAIIKKNRKNYSVWKYGLEYISTDWPPILKSPTGEIIEEVNNFKDYLSKQNKAA